MKSFDHFLIVTCEFWFNIYNVPYISMNLMALDFMVCNKNWIVSPKTHRPFENYVNCDYGILFRTQWALWNMNFNVIFDFNFYKIRCAPKCEGENCLRWLISYTSFDFLTFFFVILFYLKKILKKCCFVWMKIFVEST